MNRTPIKRGSPPRRYARLRPVSRKRRRLERARRQCRDAVFNRADGNCELRIPGVCVGQGGQVHEPLSRARGGSITDDRNAKLSCYACHDWVHEHPEQAEKLGLLRSAYAGGGAS